MTLKDKIERSEKEEQFDKIDDEVARQLGDGLWALNLEKSLKNVNEITDKKVNKWQTILLLILLLECLLTISLLFFAPGQTLNKHIETVMGTSVIMANPKFNKNASSNPDYVLKEYYKGEGITTSSEKVKAIANMAIGSQNVLMLICIIPTMIKYVLSVWAFNAFQKIPMFIFFGSVFFNWILSLQFMIAQWADPASNTVIAMQGPIKAASNTNGQYIGIILWTLWMCLLGVEILLSQFVVFANNSADTEHHIRFKYVKEVAQSTEQTPGVRKWE